MKEYHFKPHLGIFFIIAVVIPSVILSVIAARAVNREEVYMMKRLRDTLLAEVTHLVSLVNTELRDVQQELNSTVPLVEAGNIDNTFSLWKKRNALVGVPFLLSPDNEILYPSYEKGSLDKKELSFLNQNREFLGNGVSIPVFQNIAIAYEDDILPELNQLEQQEVQRAAQYVQNEIASGESFSRQTDYTGQEARHQQVMSRFEQYEPIRKRVYEKAQAKGQVVYRSVQTQSAGTKMVDSKDVKTSKAQESIFISEPLNFSQIIAGKAYGIIPRFFNEKLELLFWKKLKTGHIAGCMVNYDRFREEILSVLPNVYSPVRILTILDENSRPIITPGDNKARDWRRPFVAREISEMLPRWEVVAYLTDPQAITSKAMVVSNVMWMLIVILFVTIVTGGTLVLRSLHSEINLAQKKTTFVSNVSHELKTPLTSIRMFAEMLKEKRQPDEKKQQIYLSIMVSETERLTRLINNVLDFSQRGKEKKRYAMKEIDIVSLCRDIVDSQRLRLEYKGFELDFQGITGAITTRVDEEAFKQAVLNLISNAEKYSSQNKKIDFDVSVKEKFIIINIKDRGMGVPPEDADKIFKEFYRVDDSLISRVRGTGLGLTIARQIIRDHGGDIFYSSRDGGGSIFQIKLPIIDKG